MSKYTDEADDVQFSEPILAQKCVKCLIGFAEATEWKLKADITVDGKMYEKGTAFDACKLTIQIDDESVKTEHADAKPRLTIEDQFNIEKYPFFDKKTATGRFMGKSKLYQLEEAFGFDPIFEVNGQVVEPFITKTGRKVAPKIEGVARKLNPDFFNAYFNIVDGKAVPNMNNFENKVIYCDISVDTNEQFGSKNVIDRYVKAPLI